MDYGAKIVICVRTLHGLLDKHLKTITELKATM